MEDGRSISKEEVPQSASLPPKKRHLEEARASDNRDGLDSLVGAIESIEKSGKDDKASKAVRITTSKILGTAHPHKPRIGPEYQANIPPLEIRPQHLSGFKKASPERLPFPESQVLEDRK